MVEVREVGSLQAASLAAVQQLASLLCVRVAQAVQAMSVNIECCEEWSQYSPEYAVAWHRC